MDDIKNIKYLLRDINIVRKKIEEREENEEIFNIFTILRKKTDEVYLHSRFLSALLDPSGPHKLGTFILNAFLYIVGSKFKYNENTLKVYPNNKKRSEYKNIDICFIDRAIRQAVIIENKIRHFDTNHEDKGQLENYYEKLIEEDKIPEDDIEVYYLTLNGHEPSEESVNLSGKFPKLKEKVKCISYSVEILDWLREVAKESYNWPALRETIIQYTKLIKAMTGKDLNEIEIKEIKKVIELNEENMLSTKLLIDNFIHVRSYTIQDFWNELTTEFSNRNFKILKTIKEEEIKNLVYNGQKIFLEIVIKKKDVPIWIKNDFNGWLFWGVYNDEENQIPKSLIKKIDNLISKYSEFESDEYWPCYKYFGETEQEKIRLSDFSCEGTFKLISGKDRKKVIIKLANQIEDFINKLQEF